MGSVLAKTGDVEAKSRELEPKIHAFFDYVCKVTDASVGEIIHSARLVERFVEAALKSESIDGQIEPNTGLVSEESMGTVLLCGVSVTMKVMRDVSYRNGWWGRAFGIPTSNVNKSEIVFLRELQHIVVVSVEDFWDCYERIIGRWNS
ncbi:MAG: hypothetical protein EZS28_056352, partial [Streblomastix strix]